MRVKIGGLFKFKNLPKNVKKEITDRLIKKYPEIVPKTKDERIKSFVKGKYVEDGKPNSKPKEEVIIEEEIVEELEKHLIDEEYLNTLSFKKLKELGKDFGVTDRSKKKLIKEILAAVNE